MATSKIPTRRRTWSYRQLTDITEAQIRWYTEFFHEQVAAEQDADSQHGWERLVRNWAHGAWNLWDQITQGLQDPGDRARLQALVDAVKVSD